MTRITIGVPAYNNMATIERTIASITAQTVSDFRVILSDDHSRDGTFELCKRAADVDNRFTASRPPERMGLLHFGRVLGLADTEFFVWLAGDDWWAPEFLQRCLSVLEERSAVSAMPEVEFVDGPDDAPIPDTSTLEGDWRQRALEFLSNPNGSRMYGLFRTEVLKNAMPERAMFAWDWYVTLGALKAGTQIGIPEKLLFRERTPWREYSTLVDQIYGQGIFRRYPLLDVSIAALRRGFLPPSPKTARTLWQLNLAKRDERALVNNTLEFFDDLPDRNLAAVSKQSKDLWASEAVARLNDPNATNALKNSAMRALKHLADHGAAEVLVRVGRHLAKRGDHQEALGLFQRAFASGCVDAEIDLIAAKEHLDLLDPIAASSRIGTLAKSGNRHALRNLAQRFCNGRVAGLSRDVLAQIFANGDFEDHDILKARRLLAEGETGCEPQKTPFPWDERSDTAKQKPNVAPARARNPARIAAILVAQNSAHTLEQLLEHYRAQKILIYLVDHASDDETATIALRYRDNPVAGFFREPDVGYFDLTRQLELRRSIIETIDCDWILNADADEFLETTSGQTLPDLVAGYTDTDAIAFDCDEYVFLPIAESEAHSPHSFQQSMTHYVTLHERDAKQRLFRANAPLDHWLKTGGHTVTTEPGQIAAERLQLRHYIGLSLDHVRAQYLGRVYAGLDLVKSWHSNRRAHLPNFICEPDPSLFSDRAQVGLRKGKPVECLPIFSKPQIHEAPQNPSKDPCDIRIVSSADRLSNWAAEHLRRALPGTDIRVAVSPYSELYSAVRVPILHVTQRPDDDYDDPADWLHSISVIRQAALLGRRRYAEIRREDLGAAAEKLADAAQKVVAAPARQVREFSAFAPLQGIALDTAQWMHARRMLKSLGYWPTESSLNDPG